MSRAHPALCHLGCLPGLCLWDQCQVWREPTPHPTPEQGTYTPLHPHHLIKSPPQPCRLGASLPISQREKLRLAGNDEPSGPQSQ